MARPPAPRPGAKPAPPRNSGREGLHSVEVQRRAPAPGNGKKVTLALAVVVMLVLALFERPICLLMTLALVPTMVAWLIDDTPGQSLIRTVAPLNFASSLPFAIKLWHENNSLDQVFTFLSTGYTWVALYGAALFGWMLYYLAPAVITTVVQRRIERARETAIERQQALKDEWGDEVET
ncbi:MAG TPA: hypothetical protein VGV37_19130 [Aliidongia sp.]|uniref:hypothetical protein n=1 Tax=Aliidongia sp. TaxID=1914230 RepID=UPI002DDD66CB|nr:hypothetical protein [Aliidongia sp.]HEV2676647.1 hypothetical protein [Aliidongia sp.]